MSRHGRMPLLAANWKMNVGPVAARAFMNTFLASYAPRNDRRVIFFPPAVSLAVVSDACRGRTDILTGAQNIFFEENGAFTGETSAQLAHEAGAGYVLIGHSERRQVFGETDEEVRRKCKAAFKEGLSPMLCVGETLFERNDGRAADTVGRQLRSVTGYLDAVQVAALTIAYEPVWAIGTGESATPGDASEMHKHIRHLLRQSIGDQADGVAILYGGSVKPENARDILSAADVDGVLVGGASTKPDSWLQIAGA